MFRRCSLIAIATVALLSVTSAVDAAPGGKGGGKGGGDSSSSIVMDQSGPIAYGQAVTFTVSTTASDRPFSQVHCEQGGTLVYSSTRGHFQDYYDYFGEPVHYLSSLSWPAGDADCTASLIYQARNGRMRTLASTSFHVDG